MIVPAPAGRTLRPPSFLLPAIACLVVAGGAGALAAATGSLLPLIAAATLIGGLLLLVQPELGTILFLALLWMNVPAVLVRFHGVPDLAATAFAGLLVIPVAYHLLSRRPVIITPALFALLFFLAANLVSAAMSSNPPLAMSSIMTLLGEGLLVYLLVLNAVRTPRMVQAAVWILVLSAVLMSLLSFHQEATEAYRDPYLGFSQTTRYQDPIDEIPDPDSRPRMMGPIGEQNRYAQILLVVVPLALFGLNIRHPLWRRVVPAVAAFIILGGILLTFSRGTALALGVLLLMLVAWRYIRIRHLLPIAAAVVLAVMLVAPEFIVRVESIGGVSSLVSSQGEDPDGAILGRATSNLAALLVFADYPVAGVGPGVYTIDYSTDYANQLGLRYFPGTRRAHNMYLEWAADLGILGLASGVAMLGVTIVLLMKQRRYWLLRRPDYANLAGAFSLALVGYAATAVFLHLSYHRYFFALLALANSVIWILERARAEESGTQLPRPLGASRA